MKLCGFEAGLQHPFFLIAGPCVIESEQLALDTAGELKEICARLQIPFIYKSSFDKANRSSGERFRGPGVDEGLLAPDINFCTVNITNSPGLAFDYIDASNFRIASTYGGILRQYSANLSYNTWYLVDLKIDFSSSGTVDFKVNGSAATQYSSGATGSYTQVNWGAAASGSCDYYLDDIMTSNSSGDYAFGAHKVVGYKPGSTTATSSPGSNIKDNGGTVINDSSNPAYVELDDVPLSGGSDYIQQDGRTPSIYAESYFEQTAETGTVKGVNAFVAYQTASASPANSASSKICDEDNVEQDIYTGDMSETSRFYKALILAAPSGGWDAGAVNALRFRCGYATDYAPVPGVRITEVDDLVTAEVKRSLKERLLGWTMWLGMPILFAYRGWKTRSLLER